VACGTERLIWAKSGGSDVPLFRVVKDGKVGYIDATGNLAIPHRFDLPSGDLANWDFMEGFAPVQSGGKWGFIDSAGALVIPAIFEWAGPFSEGRALVRLGADGQTYRIGFIGKDGKFVGEPNIAGQTQPYSEGLAVVELATGRWAYIDKSGRIALPQRFAWARKFSQGLARVIERSGCEVREDVCDCRDFAADPLDRTQPIRKPTDPPPACRFSFIDKSGKTVLTGFQNAQEFAEGVAGVRKSKLWGFIGADGSEVIPEKFQRVKPFHDGLAGVQMDGKWGFIDHSGNVVIKPQFDGVEGFSEGIGLVWQEQGFKFIDKNGRQLFGRTFSVAAPFALGLAHVVLDWPRTSNWAYINHEGTVVYEYTAREK
jgi:hypothetical protein